MASLSLRARLDASEGVWDGFRFLEDEVELSLGREGRGERGERGEGGSSDGWGRVSMESWSCLGTTWATSVTLGFTCVIGFPDLEGENQLWPGASVGTVVAAAVYERSISPRRKEKVRNKSRPLSQPQRALVT